LGLAQDRRGELSMRIDALFKLSTVKVLLALLEAGSMRYSELLDRVIQSRSTLALALRDAQKDRLIERTVEDTRPVQTRYSLTVRGREVAEHLIQIRKVVLK